MKKLTSFLLVIIVLTACNNDTNNHDTDKEVIAVDKNLPIPNNQVVDDYQILFMGNSHVQSLNIMITALIKARFPDKTVTAVSAPGTKFLSERTQDGVSIDLLTNTPWTHVVLQAQKYSSSGAFIHPTDAAVSLIQLAKNQNTMPILYPEHPRIDNTTEGMRVHLIHTGIAEEEASCVAPVGLAWDRVIELYPELSLHQSDGNHANTAGKLLTAFVLYQVVTGESADSLPTIKDIDVNSSTQNNLKRIASYSIEQNPACIF